MTIEALTDPRHPRAAPQFICSGCRRKIARTLDVHTAEGISGMVCCYRCITDPGVHDRLLPDCRERYHDLWEHHGHWGTRAYVAWALGLCPRTKEEQ